MTVVYYRRYKGDQVPTTGNEPKYEPGAWWQGWYDGYIGFAPRVVTINHTAYEIGYVCGYGERKHEEAANDRDI